MSGAKSIGQKLMKLGKLVERGDAQLVLAAPGVRARPFA
jgi:hypothetical protein